MTLVLTTLQSSFSTPLGMLFIPVVVTHIQSVCNYFMKCCLNGGKIGPLFIHNQFVFHADCTDHLQLAPVCHQLSPTLISPDMLRSSANLFSCLTSLYILYTSLCHILHPVRTHLELC